MFRNIVAIGFICLSAGPIAAEKAPIDYTLDNSAIEKALIDYLNQRSAWGSSPAQSAPTGERVASRQALETYLARRDSWGTAPAATPAANRAALAVYLARRTNWGIGTKAAAGNPHAQALAAYLARRDSWGTKPTARSNAIASALGRLLKERASWGFSPSITSAEANSRQPTLTLAAYLERRALWNEAAGTRVAAFTMTRPARTNAPACTEALDQAASSGSITFAFGSAGLTNESSGRLSQVAATARDCTGFRIRIEGHTDAAGDAAMNQALSEERAAAVADYLQAAGIDAAVLQAIGFGESRPLVPNTTRANRAQNRRIELTVLTN